MINFTLREPPALSGDYKSDSTEIYNWLCELYESLWLANFAAIQEKKKKEGDT